MKIAITGTSGLIGYDCWRVLNGRHELWAIGRNRPAFVDRSRWKTADIRDAENIQSAIFNINPDCVIHLAAISNPDECEANPVEGYRTNSLGTRNIALACQRFDTELLFVSSDQVFGGDKHEPYTEMDSPSPVNHYGRSKAWAEQMIQVLLRRFYIVRTALIYGKWRPTFVDRVARACVTNEPVTAATDIVNSPTHTLDLAQAIQILVDKHLYGMIHIVNEGPCSRFELANFIAETLGKRGSFIQKGTKEDLKLKAKRPGYTPLENFSWNLSGLPHLRSWQDALREYLGSIYH